MSNGGYKGASPARETSPEQYPGVWELTEQFQAQADGNWPFQAADCAPKSLRFDGSSSYLSKTPTQAGNKRTWTFSFWVKRCDVGPNTQVIWMAYNAAIDEANYATISFTSTGQLRVGWAYDTYKTTSAQYRDPSAWMHCCVSVDTNHAVASERVQIAINGVKQTEFAGSHDPDLGQELAWNGAYLHHLGSEASQQYSHNYLSEIQFVDGQQLSCDEFGFFDGQGIWQPKRFTGDYSSGPVYSNAVPTADGFRSGRLPHHGFDGDLTSYIAVDNTTFNLDVGSWGLSGVLEVYTGSNHQYAVDGGSASSMTANGWTNVGNAGSITTLTFTRTDGNYPYFNAIRLDGVTLIDASVGRNSFHLDFSDGVKDQSGLGNDWTANNIGLAGGNVARTSELSENHASGSVSQPYNAFNATYISSKINTSTWAVTSTAWVGSYSAAYAELRWIPTGGYAVSSSLRVYYGCYDNTTKTTTLTITYTDGSTETDSMTSGNNNWMKLFTASNAAGKTVQKVELSPSTPSATNLHFGGFVIDNAIVESSNPDSDFFVDSPVNGNEASTGAGGQRRGNYATLNSITPIGSNCTFSNGNLDVSVGSSSSNGNRGIRAISTIGMTSGKWYCEHVITGGSTARSNIGVINNLDYGWDDGSGNYWIGRGANDYIVWSNGGAAYTGSAQSNAYGVGWGVNDVIGCAFDADEGKMYIYKNGTVMNSGTPSHTGLTDGPYFFIFSEVGSDISVNFGQRPFKHPVSGYSPLATSFMPEPAIKRGDEAATVALYTGNQGGQTVENLRISPDLVWIKNRSTNPSSGHYWHIHDTVRGKTGSFYNALYTNGSESENTYAGSTYGGLSDITEDGFTLSPAAGYSPAHLNANGTTYAAFCWDAGETTTTISVGGLNSSAYNSSRVWSGDWTSNVYYGNYTPDKVFDGRLNTNVAVTYPSSSTTITINPAISGSVIEVYYARSNNTTAGSIGSETLPSTGAGNVYAWHTLSAKSISSITLSHGNGGSTYIAAIRVDGKMLVDEFNNSRTWSNDLTGLSNSTITNPTQGFDGNPDSYADSTAGFTLDLSNHTFGTGAHTIEVKSGGATSFSVNGSTSLTDPGGGGAKVWTGTHTGELTTLASSATGASIYYLKIDGKMLLNPGQNIGANVPSIATTVRARPETGFSIATYTGNSTGGATVAHGLNKKPDFFMIGCRNVTNGNYWDAWHSVWYQDGVKNYMRMASGSTNGAKYAADMFQTPSHFVNTLGSSSSHNGTNNYVMYSWTAVEGYSAFGEFMGVGSESTGDGPFVFCGFKPAVILWKPHSVDGGNWFMVDTSRHPNNVNDAVLRPNTNGAETDSDYIDVLSNGFKVRATPSLGGAGSGYKFLYAAWAENPFGSQTRAN